MYGGNSGCTGMVIYNTKATGDNAVYGYYINEEMVFEIGPKDVMRNLRDAHEAECRTKTSTKKIMGISFVVMMLLIITGFVCLPLKMAFALLISAVLGYMPLMIILVANSRLYTKEEDFQTFRRLHGCEHAICGVLTNQKECTMESLKAERIFDPECGTAYGGYAVFLAIELGLLIAFGPGFLKSAGILLATIVVLIVLILKPGINPFTLIQRPVVAQPTEREYALGLEIMKKVKELK